ncbi:hypothetical protein FCM06_00915 [Mycoplasma bovis]|nr:hypothetical protein [Mycoplasmopsis bovis]MBT1347131.1 hypothetical protein [Mycoplasmopsis bovis]MBT1347882.1 hypothetical protein [Mycoplasmopsis bovis]MBT1348941.1 hypothetical protein [Mycoplasmopsis bovis]
MKNIKPVISYYGSKYRWLKKHWKRVTMALSIEQFLQATKEKQRKKDLDDEEMRELLYFLLTKKFEQINKKMGSGWAMRLLIIADQYANEKSDIKIANKEIAELLEYVEK